MKLIELLNIVNSKIMLEIIETKEKFDPKASIPNEYMNYEVKCIEAYDNICVIKIANPNKSPSLEELRYSFEAGL